MVLLDKFLSMTVQDSLQRLVSIDRHRRQRYRCRLYRNEFLIQPSDPPIFGRAFDFLANFEGVNVMSLSLRTVSIFRYQRYLCEAGRLFVFPRTSLSKPRQNELREAAVNDSLE